MKFSIFSKWMYRASITRNLFNSSRAFFHKWLKWRGYSPFAYMFFVILLHLMIVSSMPLCFAGNPNFVNKLPLYAFNIQFMYEDLNFSFLLWNKLHLYFVTFLLPVSIVSILFDRWRVSLHMARLQNVILHFGEVRAFVLFHKIPISTIKLPKRRWFQNFLDISLPDGQMEM